MYLLPPTFSVVDEPAHTVMHKRTVRENKSLCVGSAISLHVCRVLSGSLPPLQTKTVSFCVCLRQTHHVNFLHDAFYDVPGKSHVLGFVDNASAPGGLILTTVARMTAVRSWGHSPRPCSSQLPRIMGAKEPDATRRRSLKQWSCGCVKPKASVLSLLWTSQQFR